MSASFIRIVIVWLAFLALVAVNPCDHKFIYKFFTFISYCLIVERVCCFCFFVMYNVYIM